MKNLKTFYENTILNSIDFECYNFNQPSNNFDKIKKLYKVFKEEYYSQYKNNEIKDFADYLQGLPTCCTVPFYYHEILSNAKNAGFIFESDNREDDFLSKYWINLSIAFFTLKDNL